MWDKVSTFKRRGGFLLSKFSIRNTPNRSKSNAASASITRNGKPTGGFLVPIQVTVEILVEDTCAKIKSGKTPRHYQLTMLADAYEQLQERITVYAKTIARQERSLRWYKSRYRK